jgi:hypothetical protein
MQDCGLYVVTPVSTGGGGGSSALPASTNSIWNLPNTANTFSGNGGGLTNVASTSFTLLQYAHNNTGASDTNVIIDFSTLKFGSAFLLPVTNTAFLIPSNVPCLSPGIGANIYLTNDANGGMFVTYTNFEFQLGQNYTYWTNGGAQNIISVVPGPLGVSLMANQSWMFQ